MTHVKFHHVTKTFTRHAGRRLTRQFLSDWFRRSLRDRFFALRDVSFALEQGESPGVVGPNGAGKSTLLSLAAGLTAPDAGQIAVSGRLVPLLAVGDRSFQAKCIERVFEPKRNGAVLLCVSQDLGALERLCERVMWLDRVQPARYGPAKEVLEAYGTHTGANPG